jgi:methanogenic corrinoid protein MtbC1
MARTPDADATSRELYSIGDVAQLTGLSTDTIRVWERRYGRPVPVRLPSGHRRYTGEHVRWLRKVAEAMAQGHRPSKLIHLEPAALVDLLDPAPPTDGAGSRIDHIVDLTRGFEATELRQLLRSSAAELGLRAFLIDLVVPLIEALGRAWVNGDLSVRHEHFLSNLIEDELRSHRAAFGADPSGPVMIFATLSGEQHGLGIHSVALMAAMQGVQARVLGTDTPNDQIAASAREADATAVAISVSLATGGVETDRRIADLRDTLPPGTALVVGGRGARGVRRGARGVAYVDTLEGFQTWLRDLTPGPGA